MLENPWLRRQVETHLIFGPFSRHFGFGWIVVLFFAVNLASSISTSLKAIEIAGLLDKVLFFAVSLVFLKMSIYRQAAIGWWVTKIVLAFVCFLFLLAGLVGFFQHKPDAIHEVIIALIWFPILEFIPCLQQRQKMITTFRVLVTPVVLFFWHQTGTWYWNGFKI